jgi:hypothetical protein
MHPGGFSEELKEVTLLYRYRIYIPRFLSLRLGYFNESELKEQENFIFRCRF